MTTYATTPQTGVIITSRGLTIAGTRTTLYQVMDYLEAEWPAGRIQAWLNLTDQQMADALDYIATHRDEVEADYQRVLQQAEESRQYWEAHNQARFARIATLPRTPQQAHLYAELQAWKARLEQA